MKITATFFFILLHVTTNVAQQIDNGSRPKVGLVLSGGGAKGFAHIGVLKVIEETGLQIDYIAGTSMGAVIGGLYAADYSPVEIDSIINSYDFMELLQDKIPRSQSAFFEKQYGEKHLISFPVTKNGKITLPSGIAHGQAVYNEMNALFEHVHDVRDFNELTIPFFCMTTNLETGEAVVLDRGYLPEAIRASASLPTLLKPIEIGESTFIDGGVANNFPVDEMRVRGTNIIIGIDVQGTLEDKDNINSVVDVLNQIVNFQMYARDDDIVKELTIHIKPNTKGFSVTSFDKTVDIISEGQRIGKEHAKEFEAIAALQKKYENKKSPPKEKYRKTRTVNRVKINDLSHFSGAYIRGKMNLEFGDSISYKDLNYKLDRLSASNDFDLVKYDFHKIAENDYELEMNIKENEYLSSFKVGLHYDPLYQSSVLLNYATKHMLIKNDILSTDFIVGDNIRANLNYFVDNGIYTSYGLNSRFNSLRTSVKFDGTQVNQINKNYQDISSMAYIQTTFNRKFAVGLGLEHKFLDISTKSFISEENSGRKFYFEKSHYLNSLAYIKYDSYDKKAFVKNGALIDGEFKYYMASSDYNSNFNPFCQVKLKLAVAKTIIDKFTFHTTLEGGVTFDSNETGQFEFALGGYGENMINNHIPFYGYEFEDNVNHSYLKGELEIRYEMYKKHTIAFITNYGKTDLDVFNDGQVFQDILSGYAFVYGYASIIGPVKIVRDWTPDINQGHWYLSVGFWF